MNRWTKEMTLQVQVKLLCICSCDGQEEISEFHNNTKKPRRMRESPRIIKVRACHYLMMALRGNEKIFCYFFSARCFVRSIPLILEIRFLNMHQVFETQFDTRWDALLLRLDFNLSQMLRVLLLSVMHSLWRCISSHSFSFLHRCCSSAAGSCLRSLQSCSHLSFSLLQHYSKSTRIFHAFLHRIISLDGAVVFFFGEFYASSPRQR